MTRHDVVNHLTALKGLIFLSKTCNSGQKFQHLVGRQKELMDRIEELDDVQRVFSNVEFSDAVIDKLRAGT